MVGVKICGITNLEDALFAVEAGANAVGFILAPSPRQVSRAIVEEIVKGLPPFVLRVGVLTPETDGGWMDLFATGALDLIQIHGRLQLPAWMPPARVIPSISIKSDGKTMAEENLPKLEFRALLLDTFKAGHYGGTGETFDWRKAAQYRKYNLPIILAGGLDADNVQTALDLLEPAGVDVGSGVESSPGHKDHKKIQDFIESVRSWEEKRRSDQDATG